MGKNYDRREFLRSSLFGLGTIFAAGLPINLFSSPTPSATTNDSSVKIDATSLNKQAKELFYKKKYDEAASIYLQLISSYPAKICYYDGLAKVFNAQQKNMESAELFRQGMIVNPDNALFKQRLSLSMMSIVTGNAKAEKEFIGKYGEQNIYEASATLLIEGIALNNKNKGFYLNLKDIPHRLTKRNLSNDDNISLPDSIQLQINNLTANYENKWALSRQSKKTFINTDNVDEVVSMITTRNRRNIDNAKEERNRTENIRKNKKSHWKAALDKHINRADVSKVEKYGTLILEENINDTNTIGKLRRFYKDNNHPARYLALHRYLCIKNETPASTLALAVALCKFGNNRSDLIEAKKLLNDLKVYINTLPTLSIASYYQSLSFIYHKNNLDDLARTQLLEGLKQFGGQGGASYSLLEKYAETFHPRKNTTGVEILKALCGKKYNKNKDAAWEYVLLYIDWKNNKESDTISAETLKPLYALSRQQNRISSEAAVSTKMEIDKLRSIIYK